MNHNDHEGLKDSGRPTKRVKISADYQGNEELIPIPHESRPITVNTFEEDEQDIHQPMEEVRASDLYLDTVSDYILFFSQVFSSLQINRAILDFDFEKVCSVSLSNINIYGCLVCGKYFQGRGRKSYAYSHSIHEDHHVFINLETTKVRNVVAANPRSN